MDLEKIPKRVNSKEDKNNWNTSEEKEVLDDEERKEIKRDGTKKIFRHRNSVLTDLMKVNHFETIHNICIAHFIFLVIGVVLFYMSTPAEFWADIVFFLNILNKMPVFLTVWIGLNISCVIVYYVFKWWTLQRIQHKKKNGILDRLLLLIYVIYLVSTFAVPEYYVVELQVPLFLTFVLLVEQTRITMKIYSFVRENVPRVLKATSHKGKKIQIKSLCPNFQHFVYFLFVPTLIYRDSYPRTATIRWRFVIKNLLEFIACFFIFYCITFFFCHKAFRNVGRVKFTSSYLFYTIAGCIVSGTTLIFIMFYSVQHCISNAFAEMLRFGDRLFYQDWWNSTTFREGHRKWNNIVVDWLRTYVYMELQEMGCSRKTALTTTFFLSSFVHELILSFTFGYCIYVSFVLYFISGVDPFECLIKRRNSKVKNIVICLIVASGFSACIFFYSIERFARYNCSTTLEKPLDYFVPRFWTCNVLSLQ